MNEQEHAVACPGIEWESPGIEWESSGETIIDILDSVDEALDRHSKWRRDVELGQIREATLPAKFLRVPDCFSEVSGGLSQSGQWRPTTAADCGTRERPAPSEAAVEDRTPVTFEKPSEAELAMRAKFWKEKKEFYAKLQAMTPGQLTEFFGQQLSPLPVSGELKAEDSHLDWSI